MPSILSKRPLELHLWLLAVLIAAGCTASETQPLTDASGGNLGSGGIATASAGGNGGSNTTSSSSSGNATDDVGDGYSEDQGDCDDNNKDVNPGAKEICDDNIDNNCNGDNDSQEPEDDIDG